ncbi:MAG: hypothetical protein R3F37_21195 [Candidatus Competibacteraceae bacterium]
MEKWRSARLKDGIKPACTNREIAALKACLAMAVEWNLLDEHPLTRVKPSPLDHAGKVGIWTKPKKPAYERLYQMPAEEEARKAGIALTAGTSDSRLPTHYPIYAPSPLSIT